MRYPHDSRTPHFFVRKSSSNRRRIWSPESMNRKWCTEDICGYLVVWGTWWILGKIPFFFGWELGVELGVLWLTKPQKTYLTWFPDLRGLLNVGTCSRCEVVAKLPKALATAYCPQEQQERNLKRHWDYRVITVLGQRSRLRCVFWSLSMLHWIFSRLHWIAAEVLERFHVSPDARIGGAICFAFWVWS
jgi:hypothetical protein